MTDQAIGQPSSKIEDKRAYETEHEADDGEGRTTVELGLGMGWMRRLGSRGTMVTTADESEEGEQDEDGGRVVWFVR